MLNPSFFIYVIILMFFEISAQVLFKKSYSLDKNKSLILLVGILLYSISGYFAYKLLGYGSMGMVNIVWHMFHFILLFVVGHFVFGEKYTNKQLFACILGMTSIYLFMLEGM